MAQKIRIKLKAYDHKILDQSALKIVHAVERTGQKSRGLCLYPLRLLSILFTISSCG